MATQFRIIGIKPLCPTPNETKRFDNVERIQKALYGQYFWHYLYQGFDIDEKKDIITGTKESVSAFSRPIGKVPWLGQAHPISQIS